MADVSPLATLLALATPPADSAHQLVLTAQQVAPVPESGPVVPVWHVRARWVPDDLGDLSPRRRDASRPLGFAAGFTPDVAVLEALALLVEHRRALGLEER